MDDLYKLNKYHLGLGKHPSTTLNDKNLVTKSTLDKVMEREKEHCEQNKGVEWYKMNKSQKLKKLKEFSHSYGINNDDITNLSEAHQEEIRRLCWAFLREALDKKRISNKDIDYDIDEQTIKDIPYLIYNRDLKRFALKRSKPGCISLNSSGSSREVKPKKLKLKASSMKTHNEHSVESGANAE